MTVLEIKSEIKRTVDELPENVLENALDYLKQLEVRSKGSILQNKNIQKILKEDRELLKKLAQ